MNYSYYIYISYNSISILLLINCLYAESFKSINSNSSSIFKLFFIFSK